MATPLLMHILFLLYAFGDTHAALAPNAHAPTHRPTRTFKWQHTSMFLSASSSTSSVAIDTSNTNTTTAHLHSNHRDMNSLTEWAFFRGIHFAPGVYVDHDEKDDEWGVVLHQDQTAGTPVLKIPSELVMSSSSMKTKVPQEVTDLSICSLTNWSMDEYIPEFLLMVHLLLEHQQGTSSPWYTWLQTLPTEFNTGLYLDEFELSCLERVAFELLDHQDTQFNAFLSTVKALENQFGNDLLLFKNGADDDLIRWAFSIVFTRSWRTNYDEGQSSTDAIIVPLGDMFNHDAQQSNVHVHHNTNTTSSNDTSVCIVLNKDTAAGTGLYLSYGITQIPARFPVVFGFCDVSSPDLFSNVTFSSHERTTHSEEIKDMGFDDSTRMVFRTLDGAIGQTVWNAILYKMLCTENVEEARTFYEAHQENDLRIMVNLHTKWEAEVTLALQSHISEMLECHTYAFPPQFGSLEGNSGDHPRLALVAQYYGWMQNVLGKVKKEADLTVTEANQERIV